VATTTAEALAMGKWVLVHEHPSNEFFSSFSNCLVYRTPDEFNTKLEYALSTDPKPMTEAERHRLTWDAATERFLDAAELKASERPKGLEAAMDSAVYSMHNALAGVEQFRNLVGAGTNTKDNPESLIGWEPTAAQGGLFDRKPLQQVQELEVK
jgi:digalactosyldiacylglycerol synthase